MSEYEPSEEADGRLKRAVFADLDLPQEAEDFLLALWDLIQGIDDWVDGDKGDAFPAIWAAFVGLPGNPFLATHATVLVPVMANAVLKWQAANVIEANKEAAHYPKAYMWRACYYDVVLQVVLVVHGRKAREYSATVLRLYGESLDGYLMEMA